MNVLNPESNSNVDAMQQKIDANVQQQNVEAANTQQASSLPEQQNEEGDPNWKAVREARKKEREEKRILEQKALEKEREIEAYKAAMEAAFGRQAPNPQVNQQYYGMNQGYEPEETEDQRLEKKLNVMLAAREEKYKQQQAEREFREYPQKLAGDFPDFQQVCSEENLDYLDYHFPEISRPLSRLPDGYDKAADIYRAVKKFIPNHANAKKEAMRAEINTSKPKSISSMGTTPQGGQPLESWQSIEQRRAARYSEMQRIMKGV